MKGNMERNVSVEGHGRGVEGGGITIKMISDGGCTAQHKPVCEYPPPCFLELLSVLMFILWQNKAILFSALKNPYLCLYLHFNDRVYILHV